MAQPGWSSAGRAGAVVAAGLPGAMAPRGALGLSVDGVGAPGPPSWIRVRNPSDRAPLRWWAGAAAADGSGPDAVAAASSLRIWPASGEAAPGGTILVGVALAPGVVGRGGGGGLGGGGLGVPAPLSSPRGGVGLVLSLQPGGTEGLQLSGGSVVCWPVFVRGADAGSAAGATGAPAGLELVAGSNLARASNPSAGQPAPPHPSGPPPPSYDATFGSLL